MQSTHPLWGGHWRKARVKSRQAEEAWLGQETMVLMTWSEQDRLDSSITGGIMAELEELLGGEAKEREPRPHV
jgi:hypothetical protein